MQPQEAIVLRDAYVAQFKAEQPATFESSPVFRPIEALTHPTRNR